MTNALRLKNQMTDEQLHFLEGVVLANDDAQKLFKFYLEQAIDGCSFNGLDDPNGIQAIGQMAVCKFIRDYLIRPAELLRKE